MISDKKEFPYKDLSYKIIGLMYEVYDKHFKQVIGYLEAHKIKLGLLVLITPKGIKIKRIVK